MRVHKIQVLDLKTADRYNRSAVGEEDSPAALISFVKGLCAAGVSRTCRRGIVCGGCGGKERYDDPGTGGKILSAC